MGCDPCYSVFDSKREIKFQSTHPVWGATMALSYVNLTDRISIHAPRVGCDVTFVVDESWSGLISIHAPRVGCDPGS